MVKFSSTVIGIDVGTERVGVAIAEAASGLASPLGIFPRKSRKAESELLKIIKNQGVRQVIIGLPLDANGQKTKQCDDVEAFAVRLQKRAQIEVTYIDEWGSSEEAAELLSAAGSRNKVRHVDAHAACLLLQRFLNDSDSSPVKE